MRTTTIHCDGCGEEIDPRIGPVFELAMSEILCGAHQDDEDLELDLCLECSRVIRDLGARPNKAPER